MKKPVFTNQFAKELKLQEKRGKDLIKIKAIMFDIICENTLAAKYKEHSLNGKYINYKECHIEPDWLIIYKITETEAIFTRTGTHSDLF